MAITRVGLWLLLVGVNVAISAQGQEWVCPLRAERPADINPFHAYMEPVEFFIQYPEKTCPAWVKKLEKAREAMLKFGAATLDPVPKSIVEENQKAAQALSTILTSLIFDTQELLKGGKLCNGKSLDENSYTAAVHLVRALYASNERVAKVAGVVHGSLALSKSVPEAFKALKKAVDEQKAFQEARFLKRGCEFLKREFDRQCSAGAPAAVGEKAAALPAPSYEDKRKASQIWNETHQRMSAELELVRQHFGDKTLLEHLLIPLKLKKAPTAYQWSEEASVKNAYYEVAAPVLRLCGLYQVLQKYERPASLAALFKPTIDYAQACKPFLCRSPGQFPPPEDKDAASERVAFCEYVARYPEMEKQYLHGFMRSAREKSGEVSFCGDLQRLPPVGDAPSRANHR